MQRFFLALVALITLASVAQAAEAKRPNILFIFSDDQNFKTVSCYPDHLPGVNTPNIDALAKTGVRFSYAYMGSWCMPSRASLLTGHHPHAIESMTMEGTYPGSKYDPQVCKFWPKVMREQGYFTAQIGKWHTGTDSGWGRDWDRQIVWNRPLHPENSGAYYADQIITEDGVERQVDGYSTDNYSQWAAEFIRGKKRDPEKPWYLWLCYGAIHGPTTPADRHKGKHKNDEVIVPADIFGPRPGKPDYLDKTQAWSKGPDGQPVAAKGGEAFGKGGGKAKTFADFVHQSNDCVEALDEGIGAVMAALKESGQLDNTLVIFTADQGFGMGEHGFRMKLGPWDATYRSPMIVSMPTRFPQGKVCGKPVHGVDIVSTILSTAKIKEPWAMHGHDLTPLLKEPESDAWPHLCLYEHTGRSYGSEVGTMLKDDPDGAVHSNVPWYFAVNDGRWKYIRYLKKGETEELYDLQSDPEELTNLADDAAQKENLERLRTAAVAELRRTGASYVDELPPSRQMGR
ncbi:MAG: sulfatase-like hydrolase/transferase [Verrucomicrobiales bacterium]|nr:sulfatase-like hydrolase/transferase [Verrucomicrobiales bacterium]MCP5559960.1 sulfatase-like hydrolase/transferase [Verrucomicrobiaceae bacterium]